jgi:hypothetical protein
MEEGMSDQGHFIRQRGDYPEDPDMDRICGIMFEAEIEKFGIADGMCRRPIDPDYTHEPAYLSGHRTGLRLPAQIDPGD